MCGYGYVNVDVWMCGGGCRSVHVDIGLWIWICECECVDVLRWM